MKKLNIFYKIFICLCIIVLLFYTLFPFFIALSTSLKSKAEIYSGSVSWIPNKITFSNFINMWEQVEFGRYLLNTLIICIGTSIITFICATSAAYALAKMKFKFKGFYLNLIILTQMIAPIIIIVPLYKILIFLKLVNNLLGLIILDATMVMPFSIWLSYGFFSSIPGEILEAAEIDGCNKLSILFRIIFPIIKPGLVTIIMYSFAFAWNEFLFAYTLITKSDLKVISIGIFDFVRKYDPNWNYVTAALLVAVIPVFILFLSIEKNVVKGLTAGSEK